MYHTLRSIPQTVRQADQSPGQSIPGGRQRGAPNLDPPCGADTERWFLMTTNITIAERLPLEVLNKGAFELIGELLSTDYVDHVTQPGVPKTRDGYKQNAMALRTAFPDLHYTIDDEIEGGDRVVQRLTASGTMKADFRGMPA